MRLATIISTALFLSVPAIASDTFPTYTAEPYLLHRAVPERFFTGFQVWEPKEQDFRNQRPTDQPVKASLVVIHLWADYCKPCREEFPLWKNLVEKFEQSRKGQVRFLFLTETSGSEEMRLFLQANQSRMPRGPHYLDSGEALLSFLRKDVPGSTVPLPTTLLLDERRIVRHALIGPITARRTELVSAIDRLTRILPQ